MGAGGKGEDIGVGFCGKAAVIQLPDPRLPVQGVVGKINKTAVDIQIAGQDLVLPLPFRQTVVVRGDKEMDLLDLVLVYHAGLSPKVGALSGFKFPLEHKAPEENTAAAAVVVQLVDRTAAFLASQAAIREIDLAQRHTVFCVRAGAGRVGAGIDAFNPSKEHMHSCREQHAALPASGQRRNGKHDAGSLKPLLQIAAGEHRLRQLPQGNSRAAAAAEQFAERPIISQMVIQP